MQYIASYRHGSSDFRIAIESSIFSLKKEARSSFGIKITMKQTGLV